MSIERATAKGFLLAPAERNMSVDHYRKHCVPLERWLSALDHHL
jgi:hypothetical protein